MLWTSCQYPKYSSTSMQKEGQGWWKLKRRTRNRCKSRKWKRLNQREVGKKSRANPNYISTANRQNVIHYTFASCCNPVQGDRIFAYLTANAGLKIHRSNCPNATNLMVNYGYRVMKAEWVTTTDTTFVADLKITGIDDGPGVIERLTNKISSLLRTQISAHSRLRAMKAILKERSVFWFAIPMNSIWLSVPCRTSTTFQLLQEWNSD